MKVLYTLAAFITFSAYAAEDTYYWGLANNAQVNGSQEKIFVLGHRVADEAKNVISDTQLYSSPQEGTAEYRYDFDFKTSKLSVFSGKKPAGEGAFKCDGTLKEHKTCTYDYKTVGSKSPYRATGKDTLDIDGTYYREESDLFYGNETKAVVYRADYFLIPKAFYEELRKKVLGSKK